MIRSTKRWRLPALLALGGLTAGAAVVTAGSAQALPTFAVTRIFGPDRAATAAAIADQTFPGGADNAILVRDNDFADALAGNYLAGQLGAPILLTETNAIPPVTLTALNDLGVDTVTILGGTTAVSDSVVAALGTTGVDVERVAGSDRFDTAARVAVGGSLLPGGVGTIGGERVAIVSSGRNFPDALSAGPMVYSEHLPQLLTEVNSLPQATLTALQTLEIDRVILTGGPVAVSDTVRNQIAGAGMTVQRIFGPTRYDTSLQMAVFAGTNFGYVTNHVNFATGLNFPDALAGGPHGGDEKAPILLTPNVTSGAEFDVVCDALEALDDALATAHAFGGPVAIADAVIDALETCGGAGSGPAPGTGQVVTVDNGLDQYSFVQTSDNKEVTVTHDAQDTFTVDGASVSQAVFEANITPGDQITFTDDTTATDADTHALTNVSVLTGMVGDVNLAADTFYIINPVTGDRVGGPFVWEDANDNFGGTLAAFEGSISEGDTVTVAGTQAAPTGFTLTQGTVTGAITTEDSDAVDALIQIGVFGDDPADANDAEFIASLAPAPGAEVYVVDGATVAYAAFDTALSVGDTLSYQREVINNVSTETFTLTNVAPPAISGQVTWVIETGEDPLPLPDGTEGDRFLIVPAGGGYATVDYSAPTVFKIGATTVTELEFEAELTAGDTVVFQPGSVAPAVTQTLTLTNAALSGQLVGINTGADFYAVYAADKATILALVAYNLANHQYFINGTQRTLAQWELEVPEVDVSVTDLDDTITVEISGGFTNHRLQTTDDLTP